MTLLSIKTVLAAALLTAAMYTDLKSKKVPNKLLLFFAPVVLVAAFIDGLSAYSTVLSSLAAALIFTLPLYLMKGIGGGDFKLILVLSPLLTWSGMMNTLLAMLVWGSLLGVFQALLSKQGKQLLSNLISIATFRGKTQQLVLHKIPFTVAIFFGWLTHLSIEASGAKWI